MAEKLCGLKKKGGSGGNNPLANKIIKQVGYCVGGGNANIYGAGTTVNNTQENISLNGTNTYFTDTYTGVHTFTFNRPCTLVVSYNTANKDQGQADPAGMNFPNTTEIIEMNVGDTFWVYYHYFYWTIFE